MSSPRATHYTPEALVRELTMRVPHGESPRSPWERWEAERRVTPGDGWFDWGGHWRWHPAHGLWILDGHAPPPDRAGRLCLLLEGLFA